MTNSTKLNEQDRLKIVGLILVFIGIVFSFRMFYLQIINGEQYKTAADQSQTKTLEIPAKRGRIYAKNGDQTVPFVLNERRWLMFADSNFISDSNALKSDLAELEVVLSQLQQERIDDGSRYVVIAEDVTDSRKLQIEDKDLSGIFFREESVRVYTEGGLAAQVVGFVNDDGAGQYGVEELYAGDLSGQSGKLKAITDSSGVPLAFEESNIDIKPIDGKDVELTIDVGVQRIVEDALKQGADETSALGATGIVMDADTGEIVAMANYPSFEPASFDGVSDISLFRNNTISSAIEPGSVMKVLVAAAALDKDVVDTEYSYFDPLQVELDGAIVKNAIDYGAQTRKIEDILISSLNTGSIHLLGLLGGGEVNQQSREVLYEYLHDKFNLGEATGVDLQNEASGSIFGPNEGFGLNIRYGNMTFGQGLSTTPLQLAVAYAAIFNGGKQITPYVVDKVGDAQTSPEVVESGLLKQSTIDEVRELMRRMASSKYADVQVPGLEISGKTGTGEIANPEGGYFEDEYTGTFAGYIKGQNRTLITIVTIDRPQVRFASTEGSVPIWKNIVRGIVNTGKIN